MRKVETFSLCGTSQGNGVPFDQVMEKSHMEKNGDFEVELLPREDYETWDELVNQSPYGTVFHYSWWLEAAAYDFEILVCRDDQEELVAGIPLPRKKRMGLTLFHSPMLTPYLGPIFDLSKTTCALERVSMMRRIGISLARAIKRYDSFNYAVSPVAPDLQGFLWAGYRAELGYTFRFDAGTTIDHVLRGMTHSQRGALTKAKRLQTMVAGENNIDRLMELNKLTFARQGLPLPYPESLPRRLWAAADSHGCAKIYLSQTAQGMLVAGLLVVHDAHTTYQILAGINPEVQSLGGSNLVEWHAIQESLLAGRAFDFEGSYLRGVEQYYRRWGATALPTWQLDKAGSLPGALARVLFRTLNRPEY